MTEEREERTPLRLPGNGRKRPASRGTKEPCGRPGLSKRLARLIRRRTVSAGDLQKVTWGPHGSLTT